LYLEDENIERGILRQGDIISQTYLLGVLNPQGFSDVVKNGKPTNWIIPIKEEAIGDAMILSHSCEIDLANEIKVTSIILAPIRDINAATEKDKIEEVKNSNILKIGQSFSYLKYFYLEPNDRLKYPDGAYCDFSKCFSLRNNFYQQLLDKKVLQLKQDIADAMALKLSVYFYRKKNDNPLDEPVDGKVVINE
jgi:hypothetical protein